MSTRGFYVFKGGNEQHNVYRHYDNYPDGPGGFAAIAAAGKLAWPLPRFEADEFAAAFVAANKGQAGGLRLCPSGDWKDVASSDCEYLYVIEDKGNGAGFPMKAKVTVTCYDIRQDDHGNWASEKLFSKPLSAVIAGWVPAEKVEA